LVGIHKIGFIGLSVNSASMGCGPNSKQKN